VRKWIEEELGEAMARTANRMADLHAKTILSRLNG
jgi:hypothetical protein